MLSKIFCQFFNALDVGVTFTKTRQVVYENERVVDFEIDLTGSIDKAVEVLFSTVDGTATGTATAVTFHIIIITLVCM